MPTTTRRWQHPTNVKVLQDKDRQLPWIRQRDFVTPRVFLDQEGDGFPDGFIELLVNLFVEQVGSPPIMGIACEIVDDNEDLLKHTVWYYSANELYADYAGEILPPASKLHEAETCADTPSWIWLSE